MSVLETHIHARSKHLIEDAARVAALARARDDADARLRACAAEEAHASASVGEGGKTRTWRTVTRRILPE